MKQDAMQAWAQAVCAGKPDAELWAQVCALEDGFSSLVYVFRAFDLSPVAERELVLSLCDVFTSGHGLCYEEPGCVHPRIRTFLQGAYTDSNLPGVTLWQGGTLPSSELLEKTVTNMADFLKKTKEPITFSLWGEMGVGRRTLAKTLAQKLGMPLLLVSLGALQGWAEQEVEHSLLRESKLMGCPVCLTPWDETAWRPGFVETLSQSLAESAGYSLVCGSSPNAFGNAGWRHFNVAIPTPTVAESRSLWAQVLSGYDCAPEVTAVPWATLYRFTPGQIVKAAVAAENQMRWQGGTTLDVPSLRMGCRAQLSHGLGEKARRIEPVFSWEELILPSRSVALLKAACVRVASRHQVMEDWGFGEKLPYGAGLSMLFSGPPGTGKTMGAQVIARELGLELYKVDLATVVSKYVGETEKNLSVIFREASRSGAVLFFDEADALFGKRTEVKDAHDRYNNMEAAYLLQKIEEYDGVSVLATNFLQNIDDAFRRRMTYIIEFPFPNETQRLQLWEGMFPSAVPLGEELDYGFLASTFELSGSSIKSCCLSAAYLAAGEGEGVTMHHVLKAVRRELEKSGKTVSSAEFGPYHMLGGE